MVSKFQSPAQDYAVGRVSLDELCNTSRHSVFLVAAEGHAITAGIHSGATLVVDRSLTAVHGSIILVAVSGEYVIRRLCLYPVRGLEYLDGSGSVTIVDEEDETVEVFGVVTYALNDMRTSEFDDLAV